MRIDILTTFTEMFPPVLGASILGRAAQKGILEFNLCDIRQYSENKHHNTDDYPFGGGAGRVRKIVSISACCDAPCRTVGKKVAEQLGAITVNGSECDVVEKVKELTGGKGPECIFDAAGHWTVSEQAVQMVAKGGRIGITGLPAKPSSIPMTDIAMRQISIIGNRAYERKNWRQALSLLANGLDISMISNMVIPLKDWRKGMEFIESGEGLRVVLEP